MRHAIKWLLAFPFLVVVLMGSAYTITNTFTGGTTAVASQVNANFSAAKTAIDDNDARIDALLTTDTCTTPPCDLTSGTTLGGAAIQTGTDDDVPESGDFGAAADLDATGAISANAVALSTDTTGNYVATIADSGASEVTVSGSGSEGAAVTLALASSITRDSELRAFTVSASAASGACTAGDLWLKTTATVTLYACTATDTWSTGVGI